jgi:hypothetical protein
LKKWVDFPDGVSVSGRWIAISNHDCRNVLLYDSSIPLHEGSDPDGILGYIRWPHGVRFTSDGRFILVADYDGYVHIYMKDDCDWRGVHNPLKSLRVMPGEERPSYEGIDAGVRITDFQRRALKEGIDAGIPKGIDVDSSLNTFVTTCEAEPLAFFDFAAIIQETCLVKTSGMSQEQALFQMKYELERQDQLNQVKALAMVMGSLSWRITAPLRRVRNLLTPIWPHRDYRPPG